MPEHMKQLALTKAVDDLRERTLASISGQVARLVYLASTRDYVTGRYLHEGLAGRFNGNIAEAAIEFCHREEFEKLVTTPLNVLIRDLASFFQSTHAALDNGLHTWKTLHPYRVLIPQDCESVAKELLFSNIRIALAVLEARRLRHPQQSALQHQ